MKTNDSPAEFHQAHVLVTGGTKGIGESTARCFREKGAHVSILGRNAADGERLVSEFGPEHSTFIACDVAEPEQIERACREARERFGPVRHLINNAGMVRFGSVTEASLDDWDFTMNVNLRSMFLFAKYCIPMMQELGGGVVVNVGSVQSFITQANVAAYTSSKTAILGLTRSIAVDYAPSIRCVCICPGTIDTPMLADAIQQSPDPAAVLQECHDMHILKRIGKPEEVAAWIAFVCSSNSAFVTGQAIRIDGGLGINVAGGQRDV